MSKNLVVFLDKGHAVNARCAVRLVERTYKDALVHGCVTGTEHQILGQDEETHHGSSRVTSVGVFDVNVVRQIVLKRVFRHVGCSIEFKGVDIHILRVEFLVDVDLHELWILGCFQCTKDGLCNGQRVAPEGMDAYVDVGEGLREGKVSF